MAVFPSREWCEEAIAKVNADPEAQAAGEGWTGDFGLIVEAEPGKLDKPFAVYAEPRDGRIDRFKVLRDVDELEELEPVYLARAPYSTWKGLIQGTLDPVEMVLKRKIHMTGDLQPILERMRYKGIAERVLGQLATTFVDDA